MPDLMASESPQEAGLGIEELLGAATSAYAGERTYRYYMSGREFLFTYSLSPSCENLINVRRKAAELARLTAAAMPPAWKKLCPEGSISPEVATRIAWASEAKCKLGGKILADLDYLKLSKSAGPLLIFLSDEIAMAASGAMAQAEAAVLEELGEGSPPTD